MLFTRYEPKDVAFSYQLSTIYAITNLEQMHGMEIQEEYKDKLVEGLIHLAKAEDIGE